MRHCDGADLAGAAQRAGRRRERFTGRPFVDGSRSSSRAYLPERVIHRDVKGNVFYVAIRTRTSRPTSSTNCGAMSAAGSGRRRANGACGRRPPSEVPTMSPEMLRGAKTASPPTMVLGSRDVRARDPAAAVHGVQHGGTRRRSRRHPRRCPTREGGRGGRVAVRGRLEATIRSMLRKAPESNGASELLAASDMVDAAADGCARGNRGGGGGGEERGRGGGGGEEGRATAQAARRLAPGPRADARRPVAVALRGRAPGRALVRSQRRRI